LAAIDIYALGVVFYQLLTRVLPYEGSQAEIVRKIIRGKPVPPHKKDPAIPEQLSRIVISLLAKNPYDRPTAKQLNRALRNLEVLPEWISPFAVFIERIPSLVFGEIIAVGMAWLAAGVKLSIVGSIVVLLVLVGLLYASLCWFLFQWVRGIRNSAHLVWSGGLAIGCGMVAMVFFFSSFASPMAIASVPPVAAPPPTATAHVMVFTATPMMTPTPYPDVGSASTVVRPTRRPTVTQTPKPTRAVEVDLRETLNEFFRLEDRTDAIRIFVMLGVLFGALLGLAGVPGEGIARAFSSIIGAFIGAVVGVGLGLLGGVLLKVVDALESVFP